MLIDTIKAHPYVTAIIGVAIFIIIIVLVVAVIIYFMSDSSTDSQTFKSNFTSLNTMDPLTRFYTENKKLRSMYDAELNMDVGELQRVYQRFVAQPGSRTPQTILDKATEVLYYVQRNNNFDRSSNETRVLKTYLIEMDRLLEGHLGNIYINAQKVGGVDKYEEKLGSEHLQGGLAGSYDSFIDAIDCYRNAEDIREDAINNLKSANFDLSRYVERLEMEHGAGAGAVSDYYAKNGKRLPSRPYPGSTDPRQVLEDDYLPKEDYKDYNVPMPGIITGHERDIPTINNFYDVKYRFGK